MEIQKKEYEVTTFFNNNQITAKEFIVGEIKNVASFHLEKRKEKDQSGKDTENIYLIIEYLE